MKNLTPIEYKDQRLLLTEQLASVYETDVKNIQMNFSNNHERFEDGIHYYLLQGEALRDFKSSLPNEIGEPLKFAPKIYLWTERGASRHCKILDTNKAWEQFDILEETYFKVKEHFHIEAFLPTLKEIFAPIQLVEDHNQLVEKVEKYEKTTIDYHQSEILKRLGARKIVEVFGGKTDSYRMYSRRLFGSLWATFKKDFGVTSYRNTSLASFDDALRYVQNWEPDSSLLDDFEQLTL